MRTYMPSNPICFIFIVLLTFFPVGAAFAQTEVSGRIEESTTWTLNGSPYIVTGDVGIYKQADQVAVPVLTIEPGVEVRFEPGMGLDVGFRTIYQGALKAVGTPSSPITFTSNASVPAPGDWKGIYFTDATVDGLSVLEHCVVEYGGLTNDANLYLDDASPAIKNTSIRYSSSYGVYSTTVTSPEIQQNVFSDNGSFPLRIGPNRMDRVFDNTFTGNGVQAIEVITGLVEASTTWKNEGIPYLITGDVGVYKLADEIAAPVLTIEPGVEIRFQPAMGLFIGHLNLYQGVLTAQGTESSPIVFTSNATPPAAGDWKGIYFHDASVDGLSVIEDSVIEYGGLTNDANVYLGDAAPTIKNSAIKDSSHSGIYICGSGSNGAVISGNIIRDNLYGIYICNDAEPQISPDNTYSGNLQSDVYADDGSETHPTILMDVNGDKKAGLPEIIYLLKMLSGVPG